MFQRGDVYIVDAPLPDRDEGTGVRTRRKLVVLLHAEGAYPGSSDVPVLVASSNRRSAQQRAAAFEVDVGTSHGFLTDTVIDCRWPFTMLKADIRLGRHITTLDTDVMEEISAAVVVGLAL